MPTWTFTTSDPDTALKLSTFCAGLGCVTEREAEDTPAPAKAPARRKAKPAATVWDRDPEARKLRTKISAWASANVRRKGEPISYRTTSEDGLTRVYAAALGITPEQAAEKINAHRAHLAAFAAEQRGAR